MISDLFPEQSLEMIWIGRLYFLSAAVAGFIRSKFYDMICCITPMRCVGDPRDEGHHSARINILTPPPNGRKISIFQKAKIKFQISLPTYNTLRTREHTWDFVHCTLDVVRM
jgi:hypothetical protein